MRMIDHIVVDVEIQRTIESLPKGWDSTDLMGVACAVLYEFQTDRFRIYGSQDVEQLKERLIKADRISGYNIWRFDFPVIWGLPARSEVAELKPKTDDLLLRIWSSLGLNLTNFSDRHKGYRLDQVMRGTFGVGKVGNGADAPKWFQDGLHMKVANYCVDDVTLERDLTTFIDRHGFIISDSDNRVVRIDQNWKLPSANL